MTTVCESTCGVTKRSDEVGGSDRHHRQEARQPHAAVRQMQVEVEQAGEPDDGDRAEEEQDPGQHLVEALVLAGRKEREDPQPRGDRTDYQHERQLTDDEQATQSGDDRDEDRRQGEAGEDGNG